MTMLRIGLAQARQTDSLSHNAETIMRFVDQAGARGVQILCFPEGQTAGYRVDITRADAPVEAAKLDALHARVARRCGELGMACILGTETPVPGGKPYNSALVISPRGEIFGSHHKTKLTPMDALAYSPGSGFAVHELFGVKVGIVICYEGFRFAHSTRECVRQGAQLVFHPQNNTTRPNDWKIPIHHAMAVTRAAENTIWFASCNVAHDPHQNCRSLVIAPDGRIHAQSELKREELVVADIDISLATRAMYRFDIGDADDDDCAPLLFAATVTKAEYQPG